MSAHELFDLTDKVAIITGGAGGIGTVYAEALCEAGASVVIADVNAASAENAAAGLVTQGYSAVGTAVDVRSQESTEAMAQAAVDAFGGIDILINNAAIMATPETRVGAGWEAQFATNHLGHFALTNLLWPALQADGGARVVALSSTGHKLSPIRFDDLQFTHGYDKWQAYGHAKTANSLFAVHLDAIAQDAGVRAFAAHPGGIMTPLQRHLSREEMIASGWMDEEGHVDERFKTPEQGAATSTWAATSPQLAGMGGVYCEDCDIASPTDVGSPTARIRGVDPHAIDPDVAARLWDVSARLTGVDAFATA
jgi:NAD(P)-dependent dehydrogenase (short-subunit alcohol dehydrogenase family)